MNGSRLARRIVAPLTPIHRSQRYQADSTEALLLPAVLTSVDLLTSRTINFTELLVSGTV